MWHDMAIIILCFWSPSPKHRHDHLRHRRDTLISIVASLSSRQLLLPWLSLPLSDKVKQLHGDCISYNKATTIWLLPVADNFTKHDHLIQNRITHHVLTISHHNMPCKNKLDVLYFVCCKFYVVATGLARNVLTYAYKTTTMFRQVCVVLTFTRTGRSHTWFS